MATDRLELNSITILQGLLQIADYYQIDGLLRTCSNYLRSNTITIHVIGDCTLQCYHGIDLGLNIEHLRQISVRIRILEKSSVRSVKEAIAKHFGLFFICFALLCDSVFVCILAHFFLFLKRFLYHCD